MKVLIILLYSLLLMLNVFSKENVFSGIADSYNPPSDLVHFHFFLRFRKAIVTLKDETIEDKVIGAKKTEKLLPSNKVKHITRITINFQVDPAAFKQGLTVKGEKKFKLQLPLKETSFIKMRDLKIGAVSCAVSHDTLNIRIDFKSDTKDKTIIYKVSLDGRFIESNEFIK